MKCVSKIGPEFEQDAPPLMENGEGTTVGDIPMEDGGELENSDGARPDGSPIANFFLHVVDLIEKLSEITGHIGKLA